MVSLSSLIPGSWRLARNHFDARDVKAKMEEDAFWLLACLLEDVLDPDFFGADVDNMKMVNIGGLGLRPGTVHLHRAYEIEATMKRLCRPGPLSWTRLRPDELFMLGSYGNSVFARLRVDFLRPLAW